MGAQLANPAPPHLVSASQFSGRQNGFALHTYEMAPNRHLQANGAHAPEEDDLLDIEIHDDGGLRIFCGRASYHRSVPGQPIGIVLHALIVSWVRQVIAGSLAIAERTSYLGPWAFAIAILGVGTASPTTETTGGFRPQIIDDYRRTTISPYEELRRDPRSPASRLLSGFYRSVGFGDYIPHLS